MSKPNRFSGQIRGYVVGSDLADYMTSRYGSGWQPGQVDEIAGLDSLIMNDFRPGVGCCSITALTCVFSYALNRLGQSQQVSEIFDRIENIAVRHGYSKSKGRTNPFRISAIVRDIWRSFGLAGGGYSRVQAGAAAIRREIDAARPAVLNITFGPYRFHSVTVAGYRTWQQKTTHDIREKLFVKVFDGWTNEVRTIDFSAMTHPFSGDFSTYSLTCIIPPAQIPDRSM